MKYSTIVVIILILGVGGCAAVQKTGEVAVGATAFIAEGIINGIFDNDESILERDHRERNERRWKQVWRDNPDVNPAMTAAYKDDYE
ncbi:hypothetical protein [Crateriforma spongiae]|uniref:hypothetical protein n=1 Tax=Crateriforma spongiae TaxID=2724528 RepID=UPI001446A9AB|nr:hypothetical protein [Crateriforma spongiae]